jgi:ABC-type enterochelin transport system permease subunit
MLTAQFWKDAAERAVKTAAQVAVAFLGADAVNAFGVDYAQVAGLALGAAGVSILTSMASSIVGRPDEASLVNQ